MFDPVRSTVKRKKDPIWSFAVLFIWTCSVGAIRPSRAVSSASRSLWAKSSQAAASHLHVCSDGRRPQKMCLRCFMPYVLKNTSRIRVHRPRMKPSGGCQSLCFGFWTEEEEKEEDESRERSQLGAHLVVYIAPVEANIPCSCSRASGAARMGSLLPTRSNSWHPTTRVHATSRRWSSSLHLSRCVLPHSLPHHHFVYDYTFKSHPY